VAFAQSKVRSILAAIRRQRHVYCNCEIVFNLGATDG
jgi:hypothetical protein